MTVIVREALCGLFFFFEQKRVFEVGSEHNGKRHGGGLFDGGDCVVREFPGRAIRW